MSSIMQVNVHQARIRLCGRESRSCCVCQSENRIRQSRGPSARSQQGLCITQHEHAGKWVNNYNILHYMRCDATLGVATLRPRPCIVVSADPSTERAERTSSGPLPGESQLLCVQFRWRRMWSYMSGICATQFGSIRRNEVCRDRGVSDRNSEIFSG